MQKSIENIQADTILIFGAGMLLEASLLSLEQKNVFPKAIIDNSQEKQGLEKFGLTIISPEAAAGEYPNAAVIITADLKYLGSIERQLSELGFTKIMPIAPFLTDLDYAPLSLQNSLGSFHLDIDNYLTAFVDRYYPEYLILPSIGADLRALLIRI